MGCESDTINATRYRTLRSLLFDPNQINSPFNESRVAKRMEAGDDPGTILDDEIDDYLVRNKK